MTIIDEDPDGSGEYVFGTPYALPSAPWATLGDVADITGKTVTTSERGIAVRSLETMLGLIEAVERPDIPDRDRYWLRLATAYQAAFVHDNPDLFSRADVTSASQDGESASFRNPDAHVLAPLARKAIRRLSWRGLTRSKDRAAQRGPLNILSEEYDDSLAWKPVGS